MFNVPWTGTRGLSRPLLLLGVALVLIVGALAIRGESPTIESFKYEPFRVAPDPVGELLPSDTGITRTFAFVNLQGNRYG